MQGDDDRSDNVIYLDKVRARRVSGLENVPDVREVVFPRDPDEDEPLPIIPAARWEVEDIVGLAIVFVMGSFLTWILVGMIL